MSNPIHSFRLFKKRPSFIDGVSSIIDHSNLGSRYNFDKTEKEADVKSLYADWLAVGEDMKKAINTYAPKESR
ncbi:MAG: hypothetical protein AAB861_02360 [Patescibacteria group bacterium]